MENTHKTSVLNHTNFNFNMADFLFDDVKCALTWYCASWPFNKQQKRKVCTADRIVCVRVFVSVRAWVKKRECVCVNLYLTKENTKETVHKQRKSRELWRDNGSIKTLLHQEEKKRTRHLFSFYFVVTGSVARCITVAIHPIPNRSQHTHPPTHTHTRHLH